MSTPTIDPPGLSGERGALAPLRRHPVAVVWLATAVFSTGPVMVASASTSGTLFAFWRVWIGVALLLVVTGIRSGLRRVSVDRRGVQLTVAAGAAFGLHQLTFMAAVLRTTSVVDVTLMNTLAPLAVAALAVPLFGERPGWRFRAWSLVAIAGAVVVALGGSTGPEGNPLGMALAAVNVLFYAGFFVISKQGHGHVDTWSFLTGSLAVAAVVISTWVVGSGQSLTDVTARDLLLCLAVAAGPGLLGHFSMTWALRWVPANLPPVVMLTIPVLSGLLAWVLLDQVLDAAKIAGGVLTLAGVAGAIRSPSAQRSGAAEALDLASET